MSNTSNTSTTNSPTLSFTDYLTAVEQDSDSWLGFLVWSYIPDSTCIPYTDVKTIAQKHDLDSFLPAPPTPSDVFARVCTDGQRKRLPTDDPGVFENYLIRPVGSDGSHIMRRVVVEQVDGSNHRLGYEQTYDIVFNRDHSSVMVGLNSSDHAGAHDIAKGVEAAYYHWRDKATAYTVSKVVTLALRASHSIAVRPAGGVYFVMAQYADRIRSLEGYMDELKCGGSFTAAPLLNDQKLRAAVKQAFEDQSVGEIDRMIHEVNSIFREDRKVRKTTILGFVHQYQDLRTRIKEYSDILEASLDKTAAKLEIASEMVDQLLERMPSQHDEMLDD